MKNILTYLWLAPLMLINSHVLRQSTRDREEGSQTTDNLLWIIGVAAVAALAVAALRAYANGLIGKIG